MLISNSRWGNIGDLKMKLSALGIAHFFLGYACIPEVGHAHAEFVYEVDGKTLLWNLRFMFSDQTVLVGQYGVGTSLLDLWALGCFAVLYDRRYAGQTIPDLEEYLRHRYVPGFISDQIATPVEQQWAAVWNGIEEKFSS